MKVSKVPRHANQAWGTQSTTPVTRKARGAKSDLGCRQASADLYEGLESAHACHANRASVAESTTPVTRKAAAPNQT